MRIIRSAAHLSLCPDCGRHGHVVSADGSKTNEVHSRSAALRELTKLVLAGKVLEDEVLEVKRQIEESLMPRDCKIEGILEKITALLDQSHRQLSLDEPSMTDTQRGEKRTLN